MNLAIDGGRPAFSKEEMLSQWPIWGKEEEEALRRVLRSRIWSRSKQANWTAEETGEIESDLKRYLHCDHFLALANGTVAIELALLALGLEPGDEVLVPASTFIGSVTPILRARAVPVFVDMDPETFLLDPDCLAARVSSRTRGVIAVHLFGLPVDLDRVLAVCRAHSLFLVEDCAQAMGSRWRDQSVGTFGNAGCFSFHQDKTLSSGEGGGVTTRTSALAGRIFALHNSFWMVGAPPQVRHEISTNARISPWQAAVLRCQLQRIDAQIEQRSRSAARLFAHLDPGFPLRPVRPYGNVTRWSLYTCPFHYHPERMAGLSRDLFLKALQAEGIPAYEGHTEPVYSRPLFRDQRLTFRNDGCPVSERVAAKESVVISQRFFLGPEAWTQRLIEVVEAVRQEAPRLARQCRQ